MTTPRRRPHWYQVDYVVCPVCGRGKVTRTRIYGRKPKRPFRRYVEAYDWCEQ